MRKERNRKWERVPVPEGVVVQVNHVTASAGDITSDGLFLASGGVKVEVGDVVNVTLKPEGKPDIKVVAVVKRVEEGGFGARVNKTMTGGHNLDRYLLFVKKCKRQL